MISNSSKYTIKAVLYLGLNSSKEKKVTAREIAGPVKAPLPYISKLLQELVRRGLISSQKGPKGGFYLNDSNRKSSLMEIVTAIDGEMRIQACVLDLENCNNERPCPLHHAIYPAKSLMIDYLTNETVDSFSEKYDSVNDYFET
ncbi:MAG: Rrf2 family transcriptional regulator [Flavobacteriaceae bacterium]|nr:Rrf2 family transcriptional regulator [Flavobacteriaceae bacterium]